MGEVEQERSRLMDAEEVAEFLNVSKARVYELTRRDIVPHIHLGRQLRYRAGDLDVWLAAGGKPLSGGWREARRDARLY